MHLLNTGLMTEKFPTQVLAQAFVPAKDGKPQKTSAYLSVEINGQQHVCEVIAPSCLYVNGKLNHELYEQWSELLEFNIPVERSVALVAIPTDDVIGAAHFAITQIDLRVEDGDDRFFVEVIK